MELVWLVYFISMLDSVVPVLGMLLIGCVIFVAIGSAYKSVELDDREYYSEQRREVLKVKRDAMTKNIKLAVNILIVTTLLIVILPSKKTAYIMIGAYVAQRIAESGEVKAVSSKVYQLINKQLDQYLEEATTPKATK